MYEIIDLKGLKTFTKLCVVCLTKSQFMESLDNETDTKYGTEKINKVFQEIALKINVEKKDFPNKICSMCLRILVISYEFKRQYEDSLRVLEKALNVGTSKEQKSFEPKSINNNNNVDLLVKGEKYSLNEVLIVEEETDDCDFTGFLGNLGTEISVRFVSKHQKLPPPPKINVVSEVTITPKQTQIECGIDNNNSSLDEQEDASIIALDEFIIPNEKPIVLNPTGRKEKNYLCELCGKEFQNRRAAYFYHKRNYHQTQPKDLQCDECGRPCKTRSGLYRHKKKHKGRNFKCSKCPKTFYNAYLLKNHEEVHENKQNFLCSVCGKGFNYAISLTYHMRLHTGEKNYLCRFCGKPFRILSGLYRHIRTHTGDKPYECKFCGRKFASGGEVKCHEMGHTGYRPYHCKYCDKGFRKTHNLKLHLLNHAGPHGCEFCAKTFIEINFLKTHMKISHGIDENVDNTENDDDNVNEENNEEHEKILVEWREEL